MNDLSKDAVNWLVVGDEAQGQRIDNYLVKVLKGLAEFESELRELLRRTAPDGRFREVAPPVELIVWTRLEG